MVISFRNACTKMVRTNPTSTQRKSLPPPLANPPPRVDYKWHNALAQPRTIESQDTNLRGVAACLMRPDGEGADYGDRLLTPPFLSASPLQPTRARCLGLGGRRGHSRRPRELAGAVGEGATPCTDGRPPENIHACVDRVTPILATQRGQRISTSRTSRTLARTQVG